MKKFLFSLCACAVALSGCATTYRGIVWIRGDASDSSAIRLQQAVAVREAVVRVADEVGFEIKEKADTSTFSVIPGFTAGIRKNGLREPYKTLAGGPPHVWFSVSFTHPFSIVISDIGSASESAFVLKLKGRLEAELANVKPMVMVSYRRDRTRLD